MNDIFQQITINFTRHLTIMVNNNINYVSCYVSCDVSCDVPCDVSCDVSCDVLCDESCDVTCHKNYDLNVRQPQRKITSMEDNSMDNGKQFPCICAFFVNVFILTRIMVLCFASLQFIFP